MLFTLLAFAVAIGLLVTIHELGHYWVAKRCGVHIERFSVGFGKILFKRTDKQGCEWALSAIPLGGYVMMRSQVAADASASYKATSFDHKTVGQRAAITAAGPIANLLLAVVLYAIMGWVGTEEPAAIVAAPAAHTAAAQAGLQAGDKITALNGQPIASWSQLRWRLMDSLQDGGHIDLEAQSSSHVSKTYQLHLPGHRLDPQVDALAEVGLVLATPRPEVRELVPDSAAQQAGLQVGDVLVAIDHTPIQTAAQFVERIQSLAGATIQLHIMRDTQALSLPVHVSAHTTQQGQTVGRIGIMLGAQIEMVDVHYGPIASVRHGFERTFDTLWMSLKMIGRMLTGEASVKNISGPVSIADYAGQSARVGIDAYLHFLALISISIGLLNLLPIPMLDGGHLLYYAIEVVTGRPVSDAVKLIGQRIGLALLAALTFLAFFNDFNRLLQ